SSLRRVFTDGCQSSFSMPRNVFAATPAWPANAPVLQPAASSQARIRAMTASVVAGCLPEPFPHMFEGVNSNPLKTLQSQIFAGGLSVNAMEKISQDQRREALRAFMQRKGLNPWRWGKLAGLSDGTLRAYLDGDTKGLNNTT